MKVLVVGSGGREHAIIKTLKKSERISEIICASGNGGISHDARCVNIDVMNIDSMLELAKAEGVDMVVVAPDDPLAAGMVNAFEEKGYKTFGPRAEAAIIESSKAFSKDFMKRHKIPTANYEIFEAPAEAINYLEKVQKYPVVIKADGLALGKGVIIAETFEEAKGGITHIMEDKAFGNSGNRVVIEEFLQGPEVSVLAFTDGKTIVPMVSSKDFKRAFDGDKGLNTGGMGTISPNPHYDEEISRWCMNNIFLPTIAAMAAEGRAFKGCLYFGLMITENGPKVIEYNARFGDPEAQVVLPRLKTPLLDIFEAVIEERLDSIKIEWEDCACACVMMASGGYPEKYEKGLEIFGLNSCGQIEGAEVFHSGTVLKDGRFFTNGGRVLGITAKAGSLDEALKKAYQGVEKVNFSGAHYRKDIGKTKN